LAYILPLTVNRVFSAYIMLFIWVKCRLNLGQLLHRDKLDHHQQTKPICKCCMGLSSFRFFCKSDILAIQGHPRSLILELIISVCDFLLVSRSNFGPILHCFRDITGFYAHDPTPIPS